MVIFVGKENSYEKSNEYRGVNEYKEVRIKCHPAESSVLVNL
jgi:hypothetical protein